MPRFAESIYYLDLGGGTAAEASQTGDLTLWVFFDPDQRIRLERLSYVNAQLTVTHRTTLDSQPAGRLQALIQALPEPRDFPASGCDGLHLKLIVSDLHHSRYYTWWAGDGHQAGLGDLARLVAFLEAAC